MNISNNEANFMKHFLVINTSFFGDTLLTNPLCRNIKLIYPDSKITFIVNKPFYEVALYSDGVDEVIPYDKKGIHHGLRGAWHFYKQYKQKFSAGFDVAFIIYGNERGIILAKLFGAKKIYAENKSILNILLDNPKNIDYHGEVKVQNKNCILLEQYSKQKFKVLPMKYTPPLTAYDNVQKLLNGIDTNQLIAICTVSKKKEKDMPIKTCIELIRALKKQNKTPVILGAGKPSKDYIQELYKNNCTDFINLINKTSISELGALLSKCKCLISVDTGTMHLGLAVNVPTICLFYISTQEHLNNWAPTNIYNCRVITHNFSSNNILKEMYTLLEDKS